MNYFRYIVIGMLVCFAPVSAAQVSDEIPAYAVSYVEIMPSATTEMIAAFRDYKSQSSMEAGNQYIHLFEQIGWPGHFAVIEMWDDESSLVSHSMAASVQRFQEVLEPVRTSGYDQRPYIPMAVKGSLEVGDDQERFVITHVDIGPGGREIDTSALLGGLAEESRSEQGNLGFDVLQHRERGNHFTVIERWRNRASLDAHAEALHTKEYRDIVQPITGSPLDQRLYIAIE